MTRIVALTVLMLGVTVAAFASSAEVPVVAPELDGSTALTALTLLTGGAAVLRARLKK